jgi:hypothetical protein
MTKSFDEILDKCLRELDASGGDIEVVLSRYPEHADELRPHLEVWASLSATERALATAEGARRGRQQLLTAMARAEQRGRGPSFTNNLARKGGLGMRYAATFVVGVVLALGITFLTGNLEFGGGSQAEADAPHACLDQVLGDLDGEPGFTVDDILYLKAQAEAGEFDIDDLMVLIGDLRACFQGQLPEPPVP